MIYDIHTQIWIIIWLVVFGIFLIATYDIFYYVLDYYKPKKIVKAIFEVLFGIIQILIAYRVSFNICEGYIPIYFFLFFALGVFIYLKLLKKTLVKDLPMIMKGISFLTKWIGKLIVFLFYSPEVVSFIKNVFKAIIKLSIKVINKGKENIKKIFKKRREKENEM